MKTMLQYILMMETNELPGEAFSFGKGVIKSLISLSEKGVHFALEKNRGGERERPLLYKIYLDSKFPLVWW